MKDFLARLVSLTIGLFLFALGIVVTIKASVGYAPWDVFHVGIANTFGLSIGQVSIIVGLIIGIIVVLFREKIGLGTISNIICIGLIIDVMLYIDIISTPDNLILGILMLIIGLFIISLGTYFYIKSAFGAGPRDSLMVVLTRKTKIPVGICRSILELSVTIVGWFLGGMVGIGTIIFVIGIGFCIQITFKVFRFDITSVKHESVYDTLTKLTGKKNQNKD